MIHIRHRLGLLFVAGCVSLPGLFAGSDAGIPADQTSLPVPPSGYTWERFSEIKSAFLKPTGWHRHHHAGASSHTFALSKDSVGPGGLFETGVTIQAIKDLGKKRGGKPAAAAADILAGIARKAENRTLSTFDLSRGPFTAFGIRYRNAPDEQKPIIVHQVFVANDKLDTLFIITYEAPEASWDDAWAVGEPILTCFLIDDEY